MASGCTKCIANILDIYIFKKVIYRYDVLTYLCYCRVLPSGGGFPFCVSTFSPLSCLCLPLTSVACSIGIYLVFKDLISGSRFASMFVVVQCVV